MATKTDPTDDQKKRLILVAEDELSNYLLLETLLEPYPYQIIHVTDGKAALDECLNKPDIELVLMDIKMPVMNGLEATRLIKKERPDLPVIAITAHALEGDREKVLDAGCDEYITKPIRREELLQKVSDLLP